jgi:hypothetical protein
MFFRIAMIFSVINRSSSSSRDKERVKRGQDKGRERRERRCCLREDLIW